VAQRATVGEATETEVWHHVRQRLGLVAHQLDALKHDVLKGGAWNTELLDFIRSPKPRYKTAAISDAWPGAREGVKEHINRDLFDVIVFSAEEGQRKPEPEIYRRALSQLGVAPREAIYVDDRLKNVIGARQVGMHALFFTDSLGVRREIERLLAATGRV
jgi:putative hydrolase of the HAD superfamily